MRSLSTPRNPSLAGGQPSFTGNQPDLFQRLDSLDNEPVLVDLDIELELRGAVAMAIREAKSTGLGRERIVDGMNALLPELARPVTLRQLNAWTAVSKEYSEFPARYLPAFCAVVRCDQPLRVLARAMRLDLVDARALAAKQLGENLIHTAHLKSERRALEQRLGGPAK